MIKCLDCGWDPAGIDEMLAGHFCPVDEGKRWVVLSDDQSRMMEDDMEWQPIETAPKDGLTTIDIWANGERHTDCMWTKPTYGKELTWCKMNGEYDCDGPVDVPIKNASHWMPLPPPPVDREGL